VVAFPTPHVILERCPSCVRELSLLLYFVCLTLEMTSPPKPPFASAAPQTYIPHRAEELDLREKIRQRDRQRKLDARLEVRRAKEELAAVRAEKARLDSLATVERSRELWRLQDEARALKLREQKRLRDEAGMRAGGGYKRPVVSQQATEPSAKRRSVGADDRRPRYSDLY
jgi:hypothetical protein